MKLKQILEEILGIIIFLGSCAAIIALTIILTFKVAHAESFDISPMDLPAIVSAPNTSPSDPVLLGEEDEPLLVDQTGLPIDLTNNTQLNSLINMNGIYEAKNVIQNKDGSVDLS